MSEKELLSRPMGPHDGGVTFQWDEFDRLFPFCFSVDQAGKLGHVGSALKRCFPSLSSGCPIESAFTIQRPMGVAFPGGLAAHRDQSFVIALSGSALVLRGQFLDFVESWVFIGFPRVEDSEVLSRLGVSIGDFPHHSAILDQLLFLQGQRMALADAHRMARKLQDKNSAYAAVLQGIPDLILQVDDAGRIIQIQGGRAAPLSPLTDKALGKTLGEVLGAESAASLEPVRLASLSGEPQVAEYTVREGDARRDFEVRASSIQDGQALLIIREVTQRKKSERELVEARELALAASRAKTEFLTTMSHELRTPMNAVIGIAELLAGTPLLGEQREYVAALSRSAENLMALIDDVLDVAKIEQGKLELELVQFSLRALLDELLMIFLPRARSKGLELRVEVSSAVPERIVGDLKRVRQVLTNLIGNALKFTHEGSVRVACDVEQQVTTRRLRIRVMDTGIGIRPEVQAKLFSPFVQADTSTSRLYGGTGLGLSICRRLVQLMSGAIWVETELGKGSSFCFVVPLEQADEARSRVSVKPAASQPITKLRIDEPGAKALVVDDQPFNRLVARGLLEKRGFVVDEAVSGRAAMERLAGEHFDVVFLDVQMPGMDGFETTAQIRATGSRIPIIAITASALPEDRARCLEKGMDAYLTKPLRGRDLDHVLSAPRISRSSGQWPAVATPRVRSAQPALFERTLVDELTGGDANFTREYLDRALAGIGERVRELSSAIADPAQRAQVAFQAHALKGVVAGFTQGKPVQLLARLEEAGRASATQSSFDNLLGELAPLLAQLESEMRAFRETLGAPGPSPVRTLS